MGPKIKRTESEIAEARKAWKFALASTRLEGFEATEEYLQLVEKQIRGEITMSEMLEIALKDH